MSRYLASRAVQTAVTLALMSFVVYLLIGLMPGDPIDMMIAGDPNMKSEDAARLRAVYGLDRPLLERYAAWAWQALQGNFGYSRTYSQPVLAVLWPRLINTFVLAGIAFVIAVAIALPLGIWAASRPRSRIDYLINLFCFGGISTPPFWLALLLITLFAVKLGWLPPGMWTGPSSRVLPDIALSFGTIAILARLMRTSMLDVLNQDYIKTARAKGLSSPSIVVKHTVRNAILPVITVLGPVFVNLITGTLVVEQIFVVPGLGKHFVQSIYSNDYTMITGLTIFYAFILVVVLFITDVLYGLVDPRIRLAKGGSK